MTFDAPQLLWVHRNWPISIEQPKERIVMSVLQAVSLANSTRVDQIVYATDMQQVWDYAVRAGRKDEANAVLRVAEFFAMDLSEFPASTTDFDEAFPRVRLEADVPGRERKFWNSMSAYHRWRQKVRCQITHATGEVAAELERTHRQDGWTELLNAVTTLCKDGGIIHDAERGAVHAVADKCRKIAVMPSELTASVLDSVIDDAASSNVRKSVVKAFRVLARYQYIQSVGMHLPESFSVDVASRRSRMDLPEGVDAWIGELCKTAALGKVQYESVTGQVQGARSPVTLSTYISAMRNYVWSASSARSGAFDLESSRPWSDLFSRTVFREVVAHWIDVSDAPGALTAKSAYSYVGTIMAVCSRNGFDVTAMKEVRDNEPFLQEGKSDGKTMPRQTVAYCRAIITDRKVKKKFLWQHVEYKKIAEDLMATDKVLAGDTLTSVRRFGTCAAFAAIELAGAPIREGNALDLRHRGVAPNMIVPTKRSKEFIIRLDAKTLKGKKKRQEEVPPIKISPERLEGAQTLDWYLETIRPLFPFANPIWCLSSENEPLDHVRFGVAKGGIRQTESMFFFVSPKSEKHLQKSTFYNWMTECSDQIGLRTTAHNFRHGLATILLAKSFSNLPKVASFLMNKEATVLAHYAWLDAEGMVHDAQAEIVEEAFS